MADDLHGRALMIIYTNPYKTRFFKLIALRQTLTYDCDNFSTYKVYFEPLAHFTGFWPSFIGAVISCDKGLSYSIEHLSLLN